MQVLRNFSAVEIYRRGFPVSHGHGWLVGKRRGKPRVYGVITGNVLSSRVDFFQASRLALNSRR
jgi:hypothetical protein